MKKITCLLIVICVGSRIVLAQSADEKEVAAAVEQLRQAMIAVDTSTVNRLTAARLSYGHSTGVIEDKNAFLNEFRQSTVIYLAIDLSDQTIQFSGDVAVVRHRFKGRVKNKTGLLSVDLVALMIWQKQNGEWKLLARQGVRIPAAQ